MTHHRPKPVLLAILDGWGHREELADNAIAAAKTPNWDGLLADYPHGLINASELHVGLPEGQMGNSEVGHMNIGSGRVVMQDLPKIDAAMADGSVARMTAMKNVITQLKRTGGAFHLLGLLSPGGVHSHQAHMAGLANMISGQGIRVLVHAFLDGRDTPPQSALEYLDDFIRALDHPSLVQIATVSGRYYAMDRDKRWDRVQKAHAAIWSGEGETASNARDAITQSYAKQVNDEFVLPTVIGDYAGIGGNDVLMMANFRADRVREILAALIDPDFKEFARPHFKPLHAAIAMTEYSSALKPLMQILFPPETLTKILGEVVSDAGLKQLRIAETEKYAHVTFFFNGGREQEFPGEERILIPSPKVATYDLKPEMSAYEVTEALEKAIAADTFDLIVVNYANTDMVGHTGDIKAAAAAVEAVDACLGRLRQAVEAKGGAMLITADHGNAEQMFDHGTEQAHTAHTLNLVPVVVMHPALRGKTLDMPEGRLCDVAPTILSMLGLRQPHEMTGRSLVPAGAL